MELVLRIIMMRLIKMAFEQGSYEYSLTFLCLGAGFTSAILCEIYLIQKLLFNTGYIQIGLYLAVCAWIFLLISCCGVIVLSLSGNLYFKSSEIKIIHTGAILFGIASILLFGGILFINGVDISHNNEDIYPDTIIKLENPLVLLYNGTWVEMPWLWLSDDEYVYRSDKTHARILHEENITRYSEMIDRYGKAGCLCSMKAKVLKNSKSSKGWWEFWVSDPKNVTGF